MPRYRFAWSNLPKSLLQDLAEVLDVKSGEDVIEVLREVYGSRPQETFIEDTWELLLETWLTEDEESREEIAGTMRDRNLGDIQISDDIEYLRSCRNTINLRRVVLPTFISLGEPDSSSTIDEDDTDIGTSEDLNKKIELPKNSQSPGLTKKNPKGIGLNPNQDESDSSEAPTTQGEGNPVEHFRQWLLKNVREITNHDSIEPDDDGDIPVDSGSARTYVSPRNKPLSADIYSILLENVIESPEMLATLNEINCQTPFVKVKYLAEEKQVTLHHEVMAEFISQKSLARHLSLVVKMADSLDTELQRNFGGSMYGIDSREDEQDV